jgi:hypothetical protein
MGAVVVGRDGGRTANENGPFHRGDGRGRSSRLRELLGRASHARKLPTDDEVESSAKEEEAAAVHDLQVMSETGAVNGRPETMVPLGAGGRHGAVRAVGWRGAPGPATMLANVPEHSRA